jgi:hypothetical protein
MSPSTKILLERVASWPKEDVAELEEAARKIEVRRSGVYHATPDELKAIANADRSGVATEEEVETAFRTFRHA